MADFDPIEAALAAAAGETPQPRRPAARPTPAPQPGMAGNGPLGGVADRIAQVEGTGHNPRSTASGVGQFTDGTWVSTYRRHADARGMSDGQVLALRSDPSTARTMLDNLVSDNAQGLAARGHPVTPGTIYLAHGFGQAGAHAILSADPATPIERVVGPGVVKANPQLAGLTAGQVAGQFDQRMAGGGDDRRAPALFTPAAPDPHDPIDAALSAVADGRAAPTPAQGQGGLPPAASTAPAQPAQPGFGLGDTWHAAMGAVGGAARGVAGMASDLFVPPASGDLAGRRNDTVAGLVSGAMKPAEALAYGAGGIARRMGRPDYADRVQGLADGLDHALTGQARDQGSFGFQAGQLAGEMGSMWPLAEARLATTWGPIAGATRAVEVAAQAGGKAGLAARMTAGTGRALDLAAQGAGMGALASGGHDARGAALTGAVAAPVGAAAAEIALPAAMRAYAASRGLIGKAADNELVAGMRSRMVAGRDAEASRSPQGVPASPGAAPATAPAGWSADEAAQGWRHAANGQTEFLPAKVPARGSASSDVPASEWVAGPDSKPVLRVNIEGGVRPSGPTPRPEWKAALDRMRADQGGEATGAINHPEIGPVDVVWGSRGVGPQFRGGHGLAKIEAKHPGVVDDLPGIVEGLPVVQRPEDTGNGKFVLADGRHRAVVAPDMDGDPKRWLVTAFEENGAPALADDRRAGAGGRDGSPDPGAAPEIATEAQPSNPARPSAPDPASRAYMPDPADLGSRGSRMGLEANADLPAEVQQHVRRLLAQGVPADHALREAEITYVGARPTFAQVTRNPVDQNALHEGAKLNTPEGQALARQQAEANAALHQVLQGDVAAHGGVPTPGEASEAAARSLAAASDAERAQVQRLYQAADAEADTARGDTDLKTAFAQREADRAHGKRAQDDAQAQLDAAQVAYKAARRMSGSTGPADVEKARDAMLAARQRLRDMTANPPTAPAVEPAMGTGYIDLSGLRTALNAPELANPTIDGAKTLRSGAMGLMDAYARRGGDRFTLQQAERIRQAIGDAYDPMGGAINAHVGRLKGVLDGALDATEAGPSYKAARAAHRAWAERYDDPEGVAKLIRRDARGAFANADRWRAADGSLIAGSSDRAFIQVVRQLRANGDEATLGRLKASVIQRAYEAATGARGGNAVDQLGNSPVSGKLLLAHLTDRVGLPKLRELFTRDELGRLAVVGRAAGHINEPVPGTINPAGTSSATLNAMARMQGGEMGWKGKAVDAALLVGGQLAGHAVLPGVGGIVMGTAGNVGKAAVEAGAKASAAREVATNLRHLATPAQARAADKALAERLAAALDRRGAVQTARPRAAQVAALVAATRQREAEREAARGVLVDRMRRAMAR